MSSPRRCFNGEDAALALARGYLASFSGELWVAALALVTVVGPIRPATAAEGDPISVRFDRQVYEATPNQPFAVNVIIAPPSSGLFSYGVRLTFPSISVSAVASEAILVPPPLDFNGTLGAGALRQIEAGALAVKGTVRFDPLVEAYKAALIATFNLETKGVTLGQSIPLGLEIFKTLGTTETVFVDGEGNDLDGRITLGNAVITIVPEPTVGVLMALPLVLYTAARLAFKPGVYRG